MQLMALEGGRASLVWMLDSDSEPVTRTVHPVVTSTIYT